MTPSIGISIWSGLVAHTFPYLDQVVAPFDSIWLPDHVQYDGANVAEGWTLLIWALARYPDKICGHQVLCNSFRNPAHLAKMGATAHHLSGGRFVLGIGAGWNEGEYLSYNWPFPKPSVRTAQLAEAIQLIRALWTDAPANFAGAHYQIHNAYCEPQPRPLPPVMVGGAGEKFTLRVVAEHADCWNYIYQDVETYRHKQSILKEHCLAVGRTYAEIEQALAVHLLLGESEADVRRLQETEGVRPVSVNGFAGTPEQITERLLAGVEQGASRLILGFADSPRVDGTQMFVEEVLPHLRT